MAKVNGKGTIVQLDKSKPKGKCRKWQLRVSRGKDPRTGKYKPALRAFDGTYSQAQAALRELIEEVEHDKVSGHSYCTLEDYIDHFMEVRKASQAFAPTSIKRQESQLDAIKFHLGKAYVQAITPVDLNNMYIAMLNGDTKRGKKYGGSYTNCIHDNLSLVFQMAVKEGLIAANPCNGATPPKMDTKPKKAMAPEQIRSMIAKLDASNPRECAYLIAITTGMRRGEVCGLSWGDIDFERNVINITHSYDVLGNLKDTKTKAGTRVLPLAEITRNALLKQKDAQKEHFDSINKYRKPEEGYVVQDESTAVISTHYGKRINPGSLSRWWSEDRSKYELDGWTFHEMRHSYLSLLALSGVHPKVMQELAGHYSAQITMDIYTHVNMAQKREAANAVAKVF